MEGTCAEQERFQELYALHAPQLFRYFWFHTRSRAQAEDMVSETFLKALRTLSSYVASRGAMTPWLYGIARHILSSYEKRKGQAAAGVEARALAQDPDQEPSPPLEEQMDIWEAVGELSRPERDVIALKFGAGLTHQEIAKITGLRVIHVGVVLHRALRQLREHLSDEEQSDAR